MRVYSVLSALAIAGSTLVVASPASAAPTCDGVRATIVGTNRVDTLRGHAGT